MLYGMFLARATVNVIATPTLTKVKKSVRNDKEIMQNEFVTAGRCLSLSLRGTPFLSLRGAKRRGSLIQFYPQYFYVKCYEEECGQQ